MRPSVGHHLRYCPAIMHDAQMRKCTGQPGIGRGKHAWSFHARSRACSVRGPGRPRTTRRGLLSFAQLSSCRPESIGRRERKPCGPRSGRKPSGTQAVSSRAVRGLTQFSTAVKKHKNITFTHESYSIQPQLAVRPRIRKTSPKIFSVRKNSRYSFFYFVNFSRQEK